MAKNNVIVTGGFQFTVTEHVRAATHTNPGECVQLGKANINGVDEVAAVNAAVDSILGFGVVDFPSTAGLGGAFADINKTEWAGDVYEPGDQIPVIWCTNGTEVNTIGAINTTFAKGDLIAHNGTGQVVVASGEETAIGICLEDIEIGATNAYVKWKVLR